MSTRIALTVILTNAAAALLLSLALPVQAALTGVIAVYIASVILARRALDGVQRRALRDRLIDEEMRG